MKIWLILREAVLSARSSLVASTLIVLIAALACSATLATVGQNARAEEQVLQRLEAAGSRLLTITTSQGDDLTTQVIDQARAISAVERAMGFGSPGDFANAGVGMSDVVVSGRYLFGPFEDAVELTSGRWPQPGEGLVAQSAIAELGMDQPFGAVQLRTDPTKAVNIVGSFTIRPPFESLIGAVVIRGATEEAGDIASGERISQIAIITHTINEVRAVQQQVIGLIAPVDMTKLMIESPVGLAQLQAEIAGDVSQYGRSMLIGILGGGGALISVVIFADVLVRRADLGRRRGLGAPRSLIVAMVMLRSGLCAFLGAAIGIAIGAYLTHRLGGTPPWDFAIATATLTGLAGMASSALPATYAATRDPVRVLRTP